MLGTLPSGRSSGRRTPPTEPQPWNAQRILQFFGDPYASKLGKGEALFPDGEESDTYDCRSILSPMDEAAALGRADIDHCYPIGKMEPAGSVGAVCGNSEAYSVDQQYGIQAAMEVNDAIERFRSAARFTNSKGHLASSVTSPHQVPRSYPFTQELWRFRRRGFQDCWMAAFFIFVVIIALLGCIAQIRSLKLTPEMRHTMEKKWGRCEYNFAALHINKELHRLQHSPAGTLQHIGVKPLVEESSQHKSFNHKHSDMTKEDLLKLLGLKKLNNVTALSKNLAKMVTFYSVEALIVGVDYMICNRLEKTNETSLDHLPLKYSDVIPVPKSNELVNGTGVNLTALLNDVLKNDDKDLQSDPMAPPSTASSNTSVADGRGARKAAQELLDKYPNSWPLYALEWHPLFIFESSLIIAIPFAILSVLVIHLLHVHLFNFLMNTIIAVLIISGVWVFFAYENLFITLAALVISLVISWGCWVYGTPRKALTGALIQFTGAIFISSSLPSRTGLIKPSFPCYRPFFWLSLAASLIQIVNLSIVTIAMFPPFFRFVADQELTHGDIIYVLFVFLSDYWLLNVVEMVLKYVSAGVVLTLYYNGTNRRMPHGLLKQFLADALTSHFGAICMHALFYPPASFVEQALTFIAPNKNDPQAPTSVVGKAAGAVRNWLETKVCLHCNAPALLHVLLYGCGYENAAQYTWKLQDNATGRAGEVFSSPITPRDEKSCVRREQSLVFPHSRRESVSYLPAFHPTSPAIYRFLHTLRELLVDSTLLLSVSCVTWMSSLFISGWSWLFLNQISKKTSLITRYRPFNQGADSFLETGKVDTGIDTSSISIAFIILFAVYNIHQNFTVIYAAVWETLILGCLECPSGFVCSLSPWFDAICDAIRLSCIRQKVMELREQQEVARCFTPKSTATEEKTLRNCASSSSSQGAQYGSI